MKQVYSPADSAEAHMLVHMLGHAGIPAHIHGESLQLAVGDLPAGALLQLMVADEDYDQARALIVKWERDNAPSPAEPRTLYPVGVAIAAFIVGALGGWFINERIEAGQINFLNGAERIDTNGDGVDDLTYRYAPGGQYAVAMEADNNYDRRPDYALEYDALGLTRRHRTDRNFDGSYDEEGRYEDGLLVRVDVDTDGNGVPDVRNFYERGALKRSEQVDHAYGHVVRIDHFGPFHVERAEVDLDRDGFLETVRTYDRFGEIADTEMRAQP
jgi:hypothetical protein